MGSHPRTPQATNRVKSGSNGAKPNRPATLADVAAMVGIVPMTASRALNGTGYVSADVRQRVEEAARKLNYRPNMMARQLRGSRVRAIGVLLPDIANPFFAELVNGMMPVFQASKYTGFIAMPGRDAEEESAAIRTFIDHRIDGFVVATRGTRIVDATLRDIAAQGIAVVTIGRQTALPTIDSITADHFQGAFDATSHLVQCGHRRIGILGACAADRPHLRRYEGYVAALKAAGITPNPDYAVAAAAGAAFSTEQDGHRGLLRLLGLTQPPTAVFARNDYTAIGALHAAHELGLSVPRDIAIAGFDNIPLSSYQMPPLTTVEQPIAEQGRLAAELLLQRIEATPRRPRQAIQLPCKLIVRKSTVLQ